MDALYSALGPIHMQSAIPEIDLAPSQGTEFSSPQSMPISEQDSGCIPCTVAASLACSLDQSINFFLSQITLALCKPSWAIALVVFDLLRLGLCQSCGGWPYVVELVGSRVFGIYEESEHL